MKPRRSLDEYAAAHPIHRGGVCWVCGLPENIRAILTQGRAKGRSIRQMVGWLVSDCGVPEKDATEGKVNYHFTRCVKGRPGRRARA